MRSNVSYALSLLRTPCAFGDLVPIAAEVSRGLTPIFPDRTSEIFWQALQRGRAKKVGTYYAEFPEYSLLMRHLSGPTFSSALISRHSHGPYGAPKTTFNALIVLMFVEVGKNLESYPSAKTLTFDQDKRANCDGVA